MWPLEMLMVEAGWRPRPPIVRAMDVSAVSNILREATRHGVCIIPRGGGSNVVGAGYPAQCCVLLDLTSLDRILGFSPEDLYVYVEAGIYVSKLEEWLNKRGYTLSYHPQSSLLATIGGSISMLGSGAYTPGRGNVEDLVLWLDVVLASGEEITVGSTRSPRGWEGPGIKHLFIGAEGSLGVIVAAGLRIRPKPAIVVDKAYAMPGFQEALEAAKKLTLWGRPSIIRVIDKTEAMLLHNLDKALLLVRLEGDDEELIEAEERYVDRVAQGLGGSERDEVFQHWWRTRQRYDDYVAQLWSAGLWFDTIDTAGYWSILARLNQRLIDELFSLKGVVAVFSHAGHFYVNGGSLYHTVVMERNPHVYWRVWRKAVEIAMEEGASITHQHGYGLLRGKWTPSALGDNYTIYCLVKKVLDPEKVLNPYGLPARCHCK